MGRTILIGDLHGCFDETVELLAKMQVQAADHVVFLGDYVDRGPDNAKCCDLVRHREQVQGKAAGILGNHEEAHLRHEDLHQQGRMGSIPPTHAATRAQLRPEHYTWFRSLPLFIRFPEHTAVAVHAGVFPGRPIEAQWEHHLLHVQMIRPYDFDSHGQRTINTQSKWPSRVPDNEEGWKFWTHFWDGPEFIVFGHSVLDKPLITDKVAGIDGGCCFGHSLHGLILDTKEIVTVPAKANFGKGRRGTQNTNIKHYPIHGDVGTYS